MTYYKLKFKAWVDNKGFFDNLDMTKDDILYIPDLKPGLTNYRVYNENGVYFSTATPFLYIEKVEKTIGELGKW